MEATLRPASNLAPTSNPSATSGSTGAQSTAATGRATAVRPLDADSRLVTRTPPTSAPLKRGIDWNQNLQSEVARAQQALDYLERVASQLEALKSELSAKLSGRSNPARQIEARARQLGSTLDARRKDGGDGIDADLDFNDGQPAVKRFRIKGLDLAALKASAPQTLGFSVGSAGGPQLAASIEPGMTPEEVAQRLDRALSPVKVRVGLDDKGELLFSTNESDWNGVKDAIAVTGRGRVDTAEEAPLLAPQDWELGNPDALRQSLREVVLALARVRRSQEAASAALSAAMARTVQPAVPEEALAMVAGDFAASAAGHDYASLLAITSALTGVNRERVQALLGLR